MARHFTYDPQKVTELRMKVVECALAVLNEEDEVSKWSPFKKEMVTKMASRVLPVLNEHQGAEGGQPIPVAIYGGQSVSKHDSNQEDIQPK